MELVRQPTAIKAKSISAKYQQVNSQPVTSWLVSRSKRKLPPVYQ
jgi:hypothetical protein